MRRRSRGPGRTRRTALPRHPVRRRSLGDAALDLLRTFNFNDDRVRGFFEALVDVKVREELAALRAHVKRRNGIAHRGEKVSSEDPRASLAAVLGICRLVHDLSYRALGLEDVLEQEARERGETDYEDEDDRG